MKRAALSSAAVAASSTTAGAFSFRTCLVHIDRASAKLSSVQSSDGLFSLFSICHFYEGESSRASGITVSKNTDALNLPVRLESFAQLVLGGIEAQVPYKYVFHGGLLPASEPGDCHTKQKADLPRFAIAPEV